MTDEQKPKEVRFQCIQLPDDAIAISGTHFDLLADELRVLRLEVRRLQ